MRKSPMPEKLSDDDSQKNRESRKGAILRLIILTLGMVINSGNPAQAEPLQGRIEHSQKLPAVNKMLKPGIHYDETANKPMSNAWVRIPAWLAGVWGTKEETAVFRENYQNGMSSREHRTFTAKSKFAYGKQVDKTGQIWHYVGVPYTSDTQMSGLIEYHQVLDKNVTQQSANKAVVRTKVIVIKVRKPSGSINETYQQESITVYTFNPAEDQIQMDSSTKAFGADGSPISLTRNLARIHRVSAFKVVDEEYGRDLKSLFHQFLLAQGLASLVPD
ncbi:MAG: hypothetical protein JST89_18575 [Cyanobacteria bacterium SZAS-4]|nr:hypothetical protein [Cyanobacteria bacterium SZAS-4]